MVQVSVPRPLNLPDFPWDSLRPYRKKAAEHPDGVCDLSVGTPVDETPLCVREALAQASQAPGYPTVIGTDEVREAILRWCRRRSMIDVGHTGVIPTIGSKEAVAWLPFILGVRPGDVVLVPECAYPTYDVGARLAGAVAIPVDPYAIDTWPDAQLVWLNSPGNPDGHVLSVQQLCAVREWAARRGAIVISDECYASLPWEEPYASQGVPSLLDERVCEGDPTGLLVVYSLSKQSNLAGYRAGLLAGDPALVSLVVQLRKHSGMMVPTPVQHAMAVALDDVQHVDEQRERYRVRRECLLAALQGTDLVCDPLSVAGLYLWVRQAQQGEDAATVFSRGGGDSWALVDRFARAGIVVAPGDFYGEAARGAVRVALTASDDRIRAAALRISAMTR
ncbi:succinyldiaminopimelate transaminase [Schaalia sp. lx-100]|nr:succinyldiaminopimelate transaminase [Schaalia sp. lx-100]MCD4556774.1 succinyldiaminopimelate transaminase [Schaalia sp. lx-100]